MGSEPFLSREQRRALERQHRREAEKARRRLRVAGASGAAITMAGLLVSQAAPAMAAPTTYTVDDNHDYPAGPRPTPSGTTLRDAIDLANNNPGPDNIVFNFDTTISGPGPEYEIFLLSQIPITDSVVITGLGKDQLLIDGGSVTDPETSTITYIDRIFYMHDPLSRLDITISDLTLQHGNTSAQPHPDSRGGAILDIGENLTLTNVHLDQNTAGNDGGAVFVDPEDGAALVMQATDVTGNSNKVTAVEPTASPPFDGGGVAVKSNADTATATISISSSTFTGNLTTGGDGGGLSVSHIVGGSVTVDNNSSFGTFGFGNKPGQGNAADAGHGGGVSVVAPTTNSLTVDIDDTSFLANSSTTGGGLFLSHVGTAGADKDTFLRNRAVGDNGGGIAADSSNLTVTHSTIGGTNVYDGTNYDANSASLGGGVFAHGGTLSFGTSTISGNTAGYGGGAYFGQSEQTTHVTVTDTEISDNTANQSGGGVAASYATLQVTNSTISGNTATSRNGGGISANYSQVDIASSSITGNHADRQGGGGVYLQGGTGSISGSVISNNQAYRGGGVHLYDVRGETQFTLSAAAIAANPFTISTTTIDGNQAKNDGDGEGAGLWMYGTNTSVIESTISNNKAEFNGGGIYVDSSDRATRLEILNSTVSSNTVDHGLGGGIYNSSNNNASLDLSTVVDNQAGYGGGGGGIYSQSTGQPLVQINNSIVANNTTDGSADDLKAGFSTNAFHAVFSDIEFPEVGALDNSNTTDGNIPDDPALGPLQNNDDSSNPAPVTGSDLNGATQLPTFTHLPSNSSPVVDAGDPAYDTETMPNHDQRGLPRPVAVKSATAIVDMGAVEVQAVPASPSPAPPPPPPPPPSPSPSPSPNTAMRYVALTTPTRVLDTRNGTGAPAGRKTGDVTFDLTGVIPADATGVVLNVTVTGADHRGHVLGFPDGSPYPPTSNVNFVEGQTQANEAIIKVPADHKVVLSIFGANAHLVADAVGYFVPGDVAGANRVTPRTPTRIFDSRTTPDVRRTGAITLDLNGLVPAGTTSAVLNLTATGASGGGFIVAYPAGTVQPGTSNVNYRAGSTQANEAFVRLGTGADAGKVTLFVDGAAASVIVDLVGTVDPGPGTATELGTPFRSLDTRIGTGGPTGRVLGNIDVTLPAEVPANATGVILNVTSVASTGSGHVVVFPTGSTVPTTSSVDWIDGHAVANEVLTGIGTGKKVTLRVVGHPSYLVVDVMGYITP